MTEQEYIAKKEMLEQVNQNIKDLNQTKYEIEKEIEDYERIDYTGKYLYDTRHKLALKVIGQCGGSITCISLNKYYNDDYRVTEYFADIQFYLRGIDMRDVEEISEEEFYEYLDEFTEEMKSSIAMR